MTHFRAHFSDYLGGHGAHNPLKTSRESSGDRETPAVSWSASRAIWLRAGAAPV